MKKVFFTCGLVAMVVSFSANADSFVRVKCDDKDVGAEVYLNGKFVGNCPVDAPAPAGIVELRARKIVDDDYEQLFEKHLSMVEGVPQKVELIMSAPQLTAKAKRRQEADEASAKLRDEVAEASAQLRAAEDGDIEAMQKMAEYYDAGVGVKKDPSKAKFWRGKADAATKIQREKAEVTAAQEQLRAANAGNIEAMVNMAARYDAGLGVNKDTSQANVWRAKAEAAKREKVAQEETARRERMAQAKAQEKQRRINNVDYFEHIHELTEVIERNDEPFKSTCYPSSAVTDLFAAPTKSTERIQIKNEAALRPSTWGNPDSMIARASQQYKANSSTTEHPLLVVAAK